MSSGLVIVVQISCVEVRRDAGQLFSLRKNRAQVQAPTKPRETHENGKAAMEFERCMG